MNRHGPPPTIFGVENEYGISWPGLDKLGALSPSPITNSEFIASLFIEYFCYYAYRENPFRPNRPFADLLPDINNRSFCWPNGSKIYSDVGHPEYSTPECQDPLTAALYVKAGEYLFEAVLRDMNRKISSLSAGEIKTLLKESEHRAWFFQHRVRDLPAEKNEHPEFGRIFIHKNNTDYAYNLKNVTGYVGNSYGTHENYLCLREKIQSHPYDFTLFSNLRRNFIPFLVTRQIFSGSGGFCRNSKDQLWCYVISPKALFISKLVGQGGTSDKPLVSTKDRPFAPDDFFRLHLNYGDALMSEFATYLTLGTTRLVLSMLEDGWLNGQIVFACEEILQNSAERSEIITEEVIGYLRRISNEYSFRPDLRLQISRKGGLTPLEIQKLYLNLAKDYFREARSPKEWEKQVMEKWEFVLNLLENNDADAGSYIEWIAKKQFLERLAAKKLGLRNDKLSLDELSASEHWYKKVMSASGRNEEIQDILLAAAVQYADIDRKRGFYRRFAKNGLVKRMFNDFMVKQAMRWPPLTRAALREYARNKAKISGHKILMDNWSKFYLYPGNIPGGTSYVYTMKIPWGGEDLADEMLKMDLWFETGYGYPQPGC